MISWDTIMRSVAAAAHIKKDRNRADAQNRQEQVADKRNHQIGNTVARVREKRGQKHIDQHNDSESDEIGGNRETEAMCQRFPCHLF